MLQTFHGDNVGATLPSSWEHRDSLTCSVSTWPHSPGNSFSVCLKLSLTNATKSYKILVWLSWGTAHIFLLPCDGKMYLLIMFPGYCSLMEHSGQCLAQHQPSQISWWVGFFPHCSPAWSAKTSFFKAHLHTLALRKGRAGQELLMYFLICITFFVSHKQRISVACIKLTRKADKKSSCASTNWVSDRARSKTEIFHLLLLSLYHASNYPLFV